MNQHLKQRLIGAAILIVLGIIFLPMILEQPVSTGTSPNVTQFELGGEQRPDDQIIKTEEKIPAEVFEHYEELADEVSEGHREDQLEDKQVDQVEETPAIVAQKPKPQESTSRNNVIKATPKPKQKKDHDAINRAANRSSSKLAGGQKWALQMGSFSSQENANRLVQRLKAQTAPAYFEAIDSHGKTIYRVRVGPFATKPLTQEMQRRLKQKEKLKTLIVRLH